MPSVLDEPLPAQQPGAVYTGTDVPVTPPPGSEPPLNGPIERAVADIPRKQLVERIAALRQAESQELLAMVDRHITRVDGEGDDAWNRRRLVSWNNLLQRRRLDPQLDIPQNRSVMADLINSPERAGMAVGRQAQGFANAAMDYAKYVAGPSDQAQGLGIASAQAGMNQAVNKYLGEGEAASSGSADAGFWRKALTQQLPDTALSLAPFAAAGAVGGPGAAAAMAGAQGFGSNYQQTGDFGAAATNAIAQALLMKIPADRFFGGAAGAQNLAQRMAGGAVSMGGVGALGELVGRATSLNPRAFDNIGPDLLESAIVQAIIGAGLGAGHNNPAAPEGIADATPAASPRAVPAESLPTDQSPRAPTEPDQTGSPPAGEAERLPASQPGAPPEPETSSAASGETPLPTRPEPGSAVETPPSEQRSSTEEPDSGPAPASPESTRPPAPAEAPALETAPAPTSGEPGGAPESPRLQDDIARGDGYVVGTPRSESDTAAMDAIYNAVPESRGGRVIGTDIARNLDPRWANKRARLDLTDEGGPAAGTYARDRLVRDLDRLAPQPGEDKTLMITAGGAGSGKSSSIDAALDSGMDLIFDNQLRSPDTATKVIDHALSKGWDVEVRYVHRDFAEAVRGTMGRALEEGRANKLGELGKFHSEAQRTIVELAKKYAGDPRVEIRAANNEGKKTSPVAISDLAPGGKFHYSDRAELDRIARDELDKATKSRRYPKRLTDYFARGFEGEVSQGARGSAGQEHGGVAEANRPAGEVARGAAPELKPAERSAPETGDGAPKENTNAARDQAAQRTAAGGEPDGQAEAARLEQLRRKHIDPAIVDLKPEDPADARRITEWALAHPEVKSGTQKARNEWSRWTKEAVKEAEQTVKLERDREEAPARDAKRRKTLVKLPDIEEHYVDSDEPGKVRPRAACRPR